MVYTVGDRVFAMDLETWTTEDLGPVNIMAMKMIWEAESPANKFENVICKNFDCAKKCNIRC